MKALPLFLLMMPLMATADPTPEAVPLNRYEPLIARSPFSPASAAAPSAAPSFARNFYLTGMATVGDKAFITIASREGKQVFSLMEGETQEGMTFTRAEWAPGVGRSRAVIVRDGQTAMIAFDEVAMKAAPVATPAPIASTQPQQGGWGGESRQREWGGGRRRGGRGGGDWSNPDQRQYLREQRRAWFRAMQQQNGQGGHNGQNPNAPQQFQRPR